MDTESVFWSFAIFGSLFFLFRSVMIVSGFAHDYHGDIYHDTDSPVGTEQSFKLFSLYTLSTFIMMFGWAGLAALKQFELGSGLAVLVGLGVGILCMFLIAYLMKSLLGFSTEGATFKLEDMIGKKASVYERIPDNGTGRIQISIGGMIREVQATSEQRNAIESFKSVEIIRVIDPQTVAVRPAE